jgi:hypothetical protein
MSRIRSSRAFARLWGCAALGLLAACGGPGARPLEGAPTRAVMPPAVLSPRPALWRFTWTYRDETFQANGDGALRVLPPERARLDFFLRNGASGGFAVLIADTLFVPGPDLVKRFLPPEPLLWAALGRLALPATRDTIARIDGDTLRVDLGTLRGQDASKADGRAWRLAFAGRMLSRVERIENGRVEEYLVRSRGAAGPWELLYVNERGRRRLTISVTDTTIVEGFDDAIWRRP